MSKKVIVIKEEKCIGCGLCANTCHQSAIEIVNGKAKVVREDFCDGLGRCLPVCPVSAILFCEIDEKASQVRSISDPCPSTQVKILPRQQSEITVNQHDADSTSNLNQWPVQIKLVLPTASFFQGSNLLITADCSAFSYGNFHEKFMKGRITLIGCPKLDEVDYSEKLTEIFSENKIKSVTVVRMEVPCCGGIEVATIMALKNSGNNIPCEVVTLSTDGKIL